MSFHDSYCPFCRVSAQQLVSIEQMEWQDIYYDYCPSCGHRWIRDEFRRAAEGTAELDPMLPKRVQS